MVAQILKTSLMYSLFKHINLAAAVQIATHSRFNCMHCRICSISGSLAHAEAQYSHIEAHFKHTSIHNSYC